MGIRLLSVAERLSTLKDGLIDFFVNFQVIFGVEVFFFFLLIFFVSKVLRDNDATKLMLLYWVLILVGGALNIFLVMQFIKGIPNSTLESARIDGANELRCLFSIVLPACLPIAALITVNTFLGVWNDYSSSLIYLRNSQEQWTLAHGFYKLAMQKDFKEHKQMAMGVMMCIPPLVVFGFSQKLLIEGVSLSGMKA